MPPTPAFDYVHRLRGLRAFLTKNSLDAFITTHLPHVRYLTGFSGSNGLCLVTGRRQFFLTDFRYETQSRREVHGWNILHTRTSLVALASSRHLLRNASRVGIESEYSTLAVLRDLKRQFRTVRFEGVTDAVEMLASRKDKGELRLIAEAAAITDRVFAALLGVLKPGLRESDVAAEIAFLHRKFGADGDSFEPIVASGARGALPHGRASSKKIRSGDMVTLDFGCIHRGYCSDLTRTVAVGDPSARLRRMYEIVLESQRAAIDGARPGVPAKELDAVARRVIEKHGYGKHFKHSLGHGLGLQVHEYPKVTPTSHHILEEGNVLTIEPGIYVEGVGGVRIEDDVIIRRAGCEILNKAPKELLIL